MKTESIPAEHLAIKTRSFNLDIFFRKLKMQIEREKNRDRPVQAWIDTLEGYYDKDVIYQKDWKKDYIIIDEILYLVGGCSLPPYALPEDLSQRDINLLFMTTFFTL